MARDRSAFVRQQREFQEKRKLEAKRARRQPKEMLPKPPVAPTPHEPAAEESDA
jgi:hypothetical protein